MQSVRANRGIQRFQYPSLPLYIRVNYDAGFTTGINTIESIASPLYVSNDNALPGPAYTNQKCILMWPLLEAHPFTISKVEFMWTITVANFIGFAWSIEIREFANNPVEEIVVGGPLDIDYNLDDDPLNDQVTGAGFAEDLLDTGTLYSTRNSTNLVVGLNAIDLGASAVSYINTRRLNAWTDPDEWGLGGDKTFAIGMRAITPINTQVKLNFSTENGGAGQYLRLS